MSKYTPVKLAYKSYEPTAGKVDEKLSPVILLHCVTGSKEMWSDVAQIIADKTKRKTYVVDARNHGDSEWSDVFDFDLNADDLLHLMDTLSIQKAVLIGHSMGGKTSIRAALKKPEKIEMVFVEDMFVRKLIYKDVDAVLEMIDLLLAAVEHIPADCSEKEAESYFLKYIVEESHGNFRGLLNSESLTRIPFPLKKDAEGRYIFKGNLKAIKKVMENHDSLMSEPEGLYEGPAYFIYGDVSPFLVHEEEDNIRKFFPNAELIQVEDADHSVHAQFPDKFTEIVLRYL